MSERWHATVKPSITDTNQYHNLLSGEKWTSFTRTMATGEIIPLETHEDEVQLIFVTMGRFKVIVNGSTYTAAPNDLISIERGQPHKVTCIETGVFVSIYLDLD